MAWPTTTIDNTHLDADTDSPALARPDLKQCVDNVNDMMDSRGGADGVCPLGADAKIDPDYLPDGAGLTGGSESTKFLPFAFADAPELTDAGNAAYSQIAIYVPAACTVRGAAVGQLKGKLAGSGNTVLRVSDTDYVGAGTPAYFDLTLGASDTKGTASGSFTLAAAGWIYLFFPGAVLGGQVGLGGHVWVQF